MTRVTASNPFPCNPHIPLLLKGLPRLPWPLNPVQTAEVGTEDLSPSGSSPFAPSVPSHPTSLMDYLVLSLKLHSIWASVTPSSYGFCPLLPSSRPGSMPPLPGNLPGSIHLDLLNTHNTRAEPPQGSTSCGSVLVASSKVRKGLSSLPVSPSGYLMV